MQHQNIGAGESCHVSALTHTIYKYSQSFIFHHHIQEKCFQNKTIIHCQKVIRLTETKFLSLQILIFKLIEAAELMPQDAEDSGCTASNRSLNTK